MRYSSSFVLLVAVAIVLCSAERAYAKKLVLITHGEGITHVMDIPSDKLELARSATGAASPAIGYRYSQFGVFFADIWRWDGQFVIFDGDDTWDLDDEASQAMGVVRADLSKPLSYTFPLGLNILIALAIGVVLLIIFGRGGDDDEEGEKEQQLAAGGGAPPTA